MSYEISCQTYGKSDVRLTRVIRDGEQHDVTELTAQILLEGDFDAAYTAGDNSRVIPTDTMKNTVYAFAKQQPSSEPETFAAALCRHFTTRFQHVTRTTVRLAEQSWIRLHVDGRPHPHAFLGTNGESRTVTVVNAGDSLKTTSGIEGLRVLKTTDSGFSGFLRDEYTTLQDADDRLLATTITAEWDYGSSGADWNASRQTVRRALLETFADHRSLSVQHTLYAMASAALDACGEVESITLSMPNQHRLLVDLSPFGLTNENEVFAPTDAPFGLIKATIRRDAER